MGLLTKMKSWAQGQQKLSQLDNQNSEARAIVIDALKCCLAENGIPLNKRLLDSAEKYGRELDWKVKDYVEFMTEVRGSNRADEMLDDYSANMFQQLGEAAEDIISLRGIQDELLLMGQAASTVTVIITEAKRSFGLDVRKGSLFSEWLDALEREDMTRIIEISRIMASALEKQHHQESRGRLIAYWFESQ